MRNAKIETLCFNAQLYSRFLSFQLFPFSWFPAVLFFWNVNKNLGKPILEILLIFLHSFMVNQNEKWWHIQLFLFVLMLNHFFFFCLIEISTIWRYCEYCEVETGIPKVAVAFAFSTTQKTIAAGTPSQMKRKQKGFFFCSEISCVF